LRDFDCTELALRQLRSETWYRAVHPRYHPSILESVHTRNVPSRFSPATVTEAAFEVLYFAENPNVALFEFAANLGKAISVPDGILIATVEVTLSSAADLTDPAQAAQLGTSAQELTGNWSTYELRQPSPPDDRLAPTQLLGDALFKSNSISGIISFSAKIPEFRILAIFPERLTKRDRLRYNFSDPSGVTRTISIP
jgi:RES domain-containing protein